MPKVDSLSPRRGRRSIIYGELGPGRYSITLNAGHKPDIDVIKMSLGGDVTGSTDPMSTVIRHLTCDFPPNAVAATPCRDGLHNLTHK